MTLCIAAACRDENNRPCFVLSADARLETDSIGGEIGFKFRFVGHWAAVFSGDTSSAEDLLSTLNQYITPATDITANTILDTFRLPAQAHKRKLIEHLVRTRLGISYSKVRTRGAQELPDEVRRQLFVEIERLDFGCEVVAVGFLGEKARMVVIKDDGSPDISDTFVATGSGADIAENVLFLRDHSAYTPLGLALYHVYEAHRLAVRAPGVGPLKNFAVFRKKEDGDTGDMTWVTDTALKILERHFKKYGPKNMKLDKPSWLTTERTVLKLKPQQDQK